MAYATELTISTGNKVSLNFQSQEVSVTLTYQLEREDADVVAVVREKTAELAQAHRAAWQTLRDAKVAAAKGVSQEAAASPGEPEALSTPDLPAQAPSVVVDSPPPAPIERVKPGQVAALCLLLRQTGWSDERRITYLRETFSCESVNDLNAEQARGWLLELQRAEREADQQRRLEKAQRNGSP